MREVTFKNLISGHGLMLAETETWNDRIIGIDPVNKKLLYISQELPQGEVIDLMHIKVCSVLKDGEASTGKSGKAFSKAGLRLEGDYHDNRKYYLPFFDADRDDLLQQTAHGKLAAKWYQLVQETLTKRNSEQGAGELAAAG